MNIAVRYFTKTGNTEKLARAIADAAGAEALDVRAPVPEGTDILFLGSSVYAAGVAGEVKEFINSLSPASVKTVVCFSTAALLSSTYKQVCRLFEERGINVSEKEFHCRGEFKFMHRGRPDDADLDAVRRFAADVIGE